MEGILTNVVKIMLFYIFLIICDQCHGSGLGNMTDADANAGELHPV